MHFGPVDRATKSRHGERADRASGLPAVCGNDVDLFRIGLAYGTKFVSDLQRSSALMLLAASVVPASTGRLRVMSCVMPLALVIRTTASIVPADTGATERYDLSRVPDLQRAGRDPIRFRNGNWTM